MATCSEPAHIATLSIANVPLEALNVLAAPDLAQLAVEIDPDDGAARELLDHAHASELRRQRVALWRNTVQNERFSVLLALSEPELLPSRSGLPRGTGPRRLRMQESALYRLLAEVTTTRRDRPWCSTVHAALCDDASDHVEVCRSLEQELARVLAQGAACLGLHWELRAPFRLRLGSDTQSRLLSARPASARRMALGALEVASLAEATGALRYAAFCSMLSARRLHGHVRLVRGAGAGTVIVATSPLGIEAALEGLTRSEDVELESMDEGAWVRSPEGRHRVELADA